MAITFWKNRNEKILNQNLFSELAEDAAKRVSQEATTTKNKPTQLRRFFDEIVSFETRYKLTISKAGSDEERKKIFDQQLPFLHMLLPKVRYAEARNLVSGTFSQIMYDTVKNVQEPDDIKVFASFFEAFMGHYKYQLDLKNQKSKENRQFANNDRGRR